MKKTLLAVAAIFSASIAFSQVKNSVGIVREKFYDSHVEFLEELRDSLKNHGYDSYSKNVEAYLEGDFGSGFVFVDNDGTNYVVTNRHVVSQAESASVEFENADGSRTKYENLSVLITDDDIDLALLKFEGNAKPFKSSLKFYSGTLKDAQDVYSAGFPGLAGEPAWQFGKGTVTNANARIKELIDPSISTIIQHSAQIDGGNSGGPLLVESKSSASGYEIVGVNTWKAVGRDSTNFAIPAKLVLTLIDRAKNPVSDQSAKKSRSDKFKAALTDTANDYTSIVKFISYEYAAKVGEDTFDDVLRHAPTKVCNRVASEFAYNPIEGLRYAIAYNIFDGLSGEKASEEKLSKIVWQKEHGLYRISSLDSSERADNSKKSKSEKKSSEKKKSKKSGGVPSVSFEGVEPNYVFAISGGMALPLNDDNDYADFENGFNFGFTIFPGETGMFGMNFEYENVKFGEDTLNAFGSGLCFRIPLNFSLFSLSPNAGGGVKISMGDPNMFRFFWELGLETTFDFGIENVRPGFGVSYRGISDKLTYGDFAEEEVSVKSKNLVFKILLGFKYD